MTEFAGDQGPQLSYFEPVRTGAPPLHPSTAASGTHASGGFPALQLAGTPGLLRSSGDAAGGGLGQSLMERRSRDRPFIKMSVETLCEQTRDAGAAQSSSDTCAFRGWWVTTEGKRVPTAGSGSGTSVCVATYNILAQRFMSTDRYPHCASWLFDDAERGVRIACELRGCDPDIIAFQEMSAAMHNNPGLLGDMLRNGSSSSAAAAAAHTTSPGAASMTASLAGFTGQYDSRFVSITQSDGSGCDASRSEFEGVAIFFKRSRFDVLEHLPLRFNVIAQSSRGISAGERKRLQTSSHNVANIVALYDRRTGAGLGSGGTVYIVGTMHAMWDSQRAAGQVWQMQQLLQNIEQLKEIYESGGDNAVAVVLGDFNAELAQPSIQYALSGSHAPMSPALAAASQLQQQRQQLMTPLTPPPDAADDACASAAAAATAAAAAATTTTMSTTQQWWYLDMWHSEPPSHQLRLRSAYADYCASHPRKVSAVNPSTNGEGKVIDHILFDVDSMVCVSVGRLGDKVDIPNSRAPSDHYPLAAQLVPRAGLELAPTD